MTSMRCRSLRCTKESFAACRGLQCSHYVALATLRQDVQFTLIHHSSRHVVHNLDRQLLLSLSQMQEPCFTSSKHVFLILLLLVGVPRLDHAMLTHDRVDGMLRNPSADTDAQLRSERVVSDFWILPEMADERALVSIRDAGARGVDLRQGPRHVRLLREAFDHVSDASLGHTGVGVDLLEWLAFEEQVADDVRL